MGLVSRAGTAPLLSYRNAIAGSTTAGTSGSSPMRSRDLQRRDAEAIVRAAARVPEIERSGMRAAIQPKLDSDDYVADVGRGAAPPVGIICLVRV